MWLVGCKCGSRSWDLGINSNHICQWDHSGPNHPIEKILECFSPLDDWQSLGNLGDIRIIYILPVLECFPLNLKIAHHLIPLDVCCSEVSPHRLVESNQITCYSQPFLRLQMLALGLLLQVLHLGQGQKLFLQASSSCLQAAGETVSQNLQDLQLIEFLLVAFAPWLCVDPHLVRAFKKSCGLCCSQYHDKIFLKLGLGL